MMIVTSYYFAYSSGEKKRPRRQYYKKTWKILSPKAEVLSPFILLLQLYDSQDCNRNFSTLLSYSSLSVDKVFYGPK